MNEATRLASIIDSAFETRAELTPQNAPQEVRAAVERALDLLDAGQLRVAEKRSGQWLVNEWLKKAVLLSFRLYDNRVADAGYTRFFDKRAAQVRRTHRCTVPRRRGARRPARRRAARRVCRSATPC